MGVLRDVLQHPPRARCLDISAGVLRSLALMRRLGVMRCAGEQGVLGAGEGVHMRVSSRVPPAAGAAASRHLTVRTR